MRDLRKESVCYDFNFRAMGGPCCLKVYTTRKSHSVELYNLVFQEVSRLEKKYSRYLSNSIVSRINNSAGSNEFIKVDHETARLLDYAGLMNKQSEGLFDITSGSFRKIWDFKKRVVPTQKEIESLKKTVGWEKVIWNGSTIKLPLKGMEIDFGGYVKEYAVDAVLSILRQNSIVSALFDMAGDVGVSGPQPCGKSWTVGIRDPRKNGTAITRIDISEGCIATSGDYERFFFKEGRRYCHIINPKTGYPVNYLQSVSVVSSQCIVAGTLCTSAMLLEEKGAGWLENVGVRYAVVDHNGELIKN